MISVEKRAGECRVVVLETLVAGAFCKYVIHPISLEIIPYDDASGFIFVYSNKEADDVIRRYEKMLSEYGECKVGCSRL